MSCGAEWYPNDVWELTGSDILDPDWMIYWTGGRSSATIRPKLEVPWIVPVWIGLGKISRWTLLIGCWGENLVAIERGRFWGVIGPCEIWALEVARTNLRGVFTLIFGVDWINGSEPADGRELDTWLAGIIVTRLFTGLTCWAISCTICGLWPLESCPELRPEIWFAEIIRIGVAGAVCTGSFIIITRLPLSKLVPATP